MPSPYQPDLAEIVEDQQSIIDEAEFAKYETDGEDMFEEF